MAMKVRKDEVTDGGIADAIMANAPAREDIFSRSESGGMMCIACEQELMSALLENRGLDSADSPATLRSPFADFPASRHRRRPNEEPAAADKTNFACDDPTAG